MSIAKDGVWVQLGFGATDCEYGVQTSGWFNLMRAVTHPRHLSDWQKETFFSERDAFFSGREEELEDAIVLCDLGNAIVPVFLDGQIIRRDKYENYDRSKLLKQGVNSTDVLVCVEQFKRATDKQMATSPCCWCATTMNPDDDGERFQKIRLEFRQERALEILYDCPDMCYGDRAFLARRVAQTRDSEAPLYMLWSPCMDSRHPYYFVAFEPKTKTILLPDKLLNKIDTATKSRLPQSVISNVVLPFIHNFEWYGQYQKWKSICQH